MTKHLTRSPRPAGRQLKPTTDGESVLSIVERSFTSLVTGPAPLAVDGHAIGHGLPHRMIPLDELRSILLHPSVGHAARNAAWRHLVARTRLGDHPTRCAWMVGAAGVAMPGLRWLDARLRREFSGVDTDAELLTGFLTALKTIAVDEGRICPRLCTAAQTSARRALAAARSTVTGDVLPVAGSISVTTPPGHPDEILDRAVAAGVLSALEADVIGVTRLEETTLAEYAERVGRSYEAVKRCRVRGEAKLKEALRDGLLADPYAEVIAEATGTYGTDGPTG